LDDEYTVVTVDQTRQVLSKLINVWFPRGERPSLPVKGKWESLKLLGATTDTGETFFLPCEVNFNSDTTICLLDALQVEFGEKLCVVLDNASYFTANAVKEFVAETPIKLCYLPRGSPELNPTEECWRQRNRALGNRLFQTLEDVQEAALAALGQLETLQCTHLFMSVSITNLLPSEALEDNAEAVGVIERDGKLQITPLVWSFAFGFATGESRTLAAFRRSYNSTLRCCHWS